jgi:ubiquinone/menaquinone biosynthesis C-methylase UbiE
VESSFTPALGRAGLTKAYDTAIRLMTRERVWRGLLTHEIAPRSGETILDVGCGTGSLAILLKQLAPSARVIGLDPDVEALGLAAEKARRAGVTIEWKQGFARDAALFSGTVDKVVSSLVFHQVPISEKQAGIAAMLSSLRYHGSAFVADYARQPDLLMKAFFAATVQLLDGKDDTQPNADGILEALISDATGERNQPHAIVRTWTGAFSIFKFFKH